MKFGPTPLALAEGALLAHATTLADRTLKKGHRLTGDDISALGRAGLGEVVTARLEPGDVGEDEAALRLAEAFRGDGLTVDNAFTGRANLRAAAAGLAVVDVERVHAINAVDEAVTIATVAPWRMVPARAVAAVVKIIPFAVEGTVLDAVAALARSGGAAGSDRALLGAAFRADPDRAGGPEGVSFRKDPRGYARTPGTAGLHARPDGTGRP